MCATSFYKNKKAFIRFLGTEDIPFRVRDGHGWNQFRELRKQALTELGLLTTPNESADPYNEDVGVTNK